MIAIGLISLLAATQGGTTSLSVGATVVRPDAQPAIAIQRGAVTIRDAGGVTVTAEGGTLRRLDGATIRVTPGAGGAMRITITY